MAKKRVYEIARERGLTTAQVMKRLEQADIAVKAAASTVSAEDEEKVFGAKKDESVSPTSGQGLPSWLNPSAQTGPRTTSKAALDAEKEARQAKVDKAKSATAKAQQQAKMLKKQLAAKKAQQSAASDAARNKVAEDQVVEAAEADEEVAPPVEAVVADESVADPVADAAELEEAPAETEVSEDTDDAEATEAPAAEGTDSDADEDSQLGPKIVSRAESEVEPEPEVVEEPAAEAAPAGATDADLRKKAQKIASQRASDLAARRRAELEREKIEVEQRKRDDERGEKKKEKKKKGESGESEFVGSRQPRVGGDADRGSRRGPSRRRRVVIDSGAGRKGSGNQGGKGKGKGKGKGAREEVVIDPEVPVTIHAGATVKELGDALHVPATEIIKVMMAGGDMVTITQTLMIEQIEMVGIELDPPREIIVKSAADDDVIPEYDDSEETLMPRAPVVTIMGHVDHGKTSLLDAIRETKVAAGEAGGITQHIGAYQVEVAGDDGPRKVTFLDTPGHEAFTALRARGAKVTDEAVLVVAADDGVKPQTVEAIAHARAADVPIIVAINKIDRENAQPEKVKAELAQHELQPVDWGGDTEVVEVSALQRTNLDGLIEMILLQADVLELKARPDAEASGYIIESKLDPGRGPVATMLVSRGTLRIGDSIVAGSSHGKVRALLDFRGDRQEEALPAMPIEIIGFDSVPDAGEFCMVVANERTARDKAQKRATRMKAELLAKRQSGLTLDDLFSRIKEGQVQELNLIVKADVGGSIEAIEHELAKIQHDEVRVRVIHSGVGGITGNDIMLASASSAIIVGFNVRPNLEAKVSAEREGVDMRMYRIIYKLREDIEAALGGMLSPEEIEESQGEAEVRQVFKASRIGTIAGCFVNQGMITRGALVRLVRDGTIVHEGTIDTLKRFKDDVKEVQQGFECGLSLTGYNDVKEGDVIESYIIKHVDRDLSS